MATPTVVQYFAWGANTHRNAVNSNSYTLRICNPTLSGNCLVLILSTTFNNTFTGISDDVGNTWSTTPDLTVNNGTGTVKTSIFVLPNCTSGGRVITVGLTTSDAQFHPTFVEVANIATSSPVGTTATSISTTAPNATAGNITASAAGSMLLAFAIDNTDFIGNGAQALTGITPQSGWSLLFGDITHGANASMAYHALQYTANATGSAQATGMTFTGGTHSMNYLVIELKSAAAGTLPPSSGIYVFGYKTVANGNITASPYKALVVNTGSFLAVMEDNGALRSVPSDTDSGGWVLDVTGSNAPVSAFAHAASLSPSQSRIVSLPCSGLPQNTAFFFFDIWNATGVQQTVTFPVTALGTSFSGTCSITPQVANGLVINFAGTGIGPILTETGPSGAYYISANYTNETDADDMFNANALSMNYYGASLSAQSFAYTIASGTSINATAVEILAQTGTPDEDLYLSPVPTDQGILIAVW